MGAYYGYLLPFGIQGLAAQQRGISTQGISLAYTIFGASSVAGRVLMGFLGRCFDPMHLLVAGFLGVAGSVLLLGFACNVQIMSVANFLLGITSGPMGALVVPALQKFVPRSLLPEALAVVLVPQALSGLAPMLAGWMADSTGSYVPGFLVGVAVLTIAAILLTIVSWFREAIHIDGHGETVGDGPHKDIPEDQKAEIDVNAETSSGSTSQDSGALANSPGIV